MHPLYIHYALPNIYYTPTIHPSNTPYTPPIHPLYTRYTPPIHPLYTRYTPAVHPLYTRQTPTIHPPPTEYKQVLDPSTKNDSIYVRALVDSHSSWASGRRLGTPSSPACHPGHPGHPQQQQQQLAVPLSPLSFSSGQVLFVDDTLLGGSVGLWRAWTLDQGNALDTLDGCNTDALDRINADMVCGTVPSSSRFIITTSTTTPI